MRRLFPMARQPWAPSEPLHNLDLQRQTKRGIRQSNTPLLGLKETVRIQTPSWD